MTFFSELKRRNVIRVALAYLALSWALIQVADVVVPALGLAPFVITVVVVLAINR